MRKFLLLTFICLVGAGFLCQSKIGGHKFQSDFIGIMKNQGLGLDSTCMLCHDDLVSETFIHIPVEDNCENCHQSTGEKHPQAKTTGYTLIDKLPDLCYYCHEENSKTTIHYPVKEGECSSCHLVHSSSNDHLLYQSNVGKICYDCHEPETKKQIHYPVEEGECNSCHDPHQSNNSTLLKSTIPGLCRSCHSDVKSELTYKYSHAPFIDDCLSCHKAHSSNENHLIDFNTQELCYSCHEEVSTKKYIHSPVKECTTCHSPHASANEKFLKSGQKVLCLSCHNKLIKTDKREIRDINQMLKGSKSIHDPIESEGCTICHNPHESDDGFLLAGTFPEGNYTVAKADNFSICFNCHDSELLTAENTTTATEFRNQNRNLHQLHIQGDKGRNCNNCHNVHAAANEHLIATKVPFGSWEMPINYKVSESGGSCLPGCHSLLEYSRD